MKPSSPGKRAPIAPDLESYHTTGFLIDAHILFFKARAGYGEKVIPQLARAINANDRNLEFDPKRNLFPASFPGARVDDP